MAHITREYAPEPTNRSQGSHPAEPATHVAPAEGRGCLFALSQPPLILFLTVIGALLLITGVYDQFLL
ncbi:hypothetical protein ACTWP5_08435 [Streptomyces sp. 4N509B]|uniref:hypothetical protein n=1 Tax=Streptomyces sp. 4N509B TaxID=3457413 RepID=UPI003FD5980B